ncbi:sulfotransferase [Halomicroarcula limicola]|uniref:Sulfotransferase n=1 Tax=Haloarcula limicola TaxID=1429915 RepID=A0A8J7Y6Q6_9EURY|nr:sulfotransferase [Halomicroarcula limicola]MBV0923116.1 sulfotransferase [Halomicroarcula limicola]
MQNASRPTFLIPGVSRAGTTTLHDYLSEHDDIFMPAAKELRFFDRDENYSRGTEYYEQQFANHDGETAVGEASPPYWYRGITFDSNRNYRFDPSDDPPARIREQYPDIKLIFTLRNPISRAYSQYWKNVRQGRERVYPFSDAIEAEIEGSRDHRDTAMCWYYKNQYSTHLERWFDLFDEDQILLLIFEEWIGDPPAALDRICEFLDVEPPEQWRDTDRQKNETKTPKNLRLNEIYHDHLRWTGIGELIYYLNLRTGYPEMDSEMERYLADAFESEISAVERIIGRKLDVWRNDPF